jgi:molecular chaperone Hsp33
MTHLALATDLLRPFQLERSQIRGRLVRLGATVDYVLRAHAYPPAVSDLLGELLVLAGGLAGGLKFDGSFSLQIRGDGPVGLMVADCTNQGRMRGYASFDAERCDEAEPAQPASWVGKGLLALTVDQTRSGGELYQGIVPLEGASLTESMLGYFHQSEQVPTGIRTALGRDPLTGTWCAGALIVQAMPDLGAASSSAREEDWRRTMLLMQTLSDSELLDTTLAPDDLLWRLFHDERVRVFNAVGLHPGCSCDEQRVETVLRSFSPDEAAEMRLPDGSISVTCQFCSRTYRFAPERLAELGLSRTH